MPRAKLCLPLSPENFVTDNLLDCQRDRSEFSQQHAGASNVPESDHVASAWSLLTTSTKHLCGMLQVSMMDDASGRIHTVDCTHQDQRPLAESTAQFEKIPEQSSFQHC